MKKKNLTSKADFEFFKERCIFWQKELGLMGLDLHFIHEKNEKNVCAETGYNVTAGQATIFLNTDWSTDKVTREHLISTAFHEMLHVLLSPLVAEAMQYYSSRYIDGLEHKIIQALVNLLNSPHQEILSKFKP